MIKKELKNPKIKNFIIVLLIQLVIILPLLAENAYGLAISNVKVTKVTSNSATIEWDTDAAARGRVNYGKTTSLGFTQKHDDFVNKHAVSVFSGISSETTYFFAVESTDLNGNTIADNNLNKFYTFKTADITPPQQVTGLKASATSSSIFLSWNAVDASDLSHYVVYKNKVPIAKSNVNSFNDTSLDANKNFNYKASAVDTSGNEGLQSDTLIASTLAIDVAAPVIKDVDIVATTDTSAIARWLTDENSTTIVLYGVDKTDKIKSSNVFEKNHSIVIDGLTKGTKYAFAVKSCDASDNCATSRHSFVAGKDITPPFINVSISRFVNRRAIDLIGYTEPFSSVNLYVNDLSTPKRILGNDEIGISGKFVFSSIGLEQDNIIKIVAVDKSENLNEKTFEVSIDIQAPAVQLNPLPKLTSSSNLSIKGSVDEPVTIKVFSTSSTDKAAKPSKIKWLNASDVRQNSVELRWEESKDKSFSHYVVYRDDVAIAVTKPANFNFFIDALADSGKSYNYEVSVIDIFGNEAKSEPISVTTLSGGAILNLKYPAIDIFEELNQPLLAIDTINDFDFGVKLKGDGIHSLRLIFQDKAQNSAVIEKDVTLDTKKPEVKITNPPSGALIFENVANEIDIVGKTEPNAKVHLFVNRFPFSVYDSAEIAGIPSEAQNVLKSKLDVDAKSIEQRIQNLSEEELESKCPSVARSSCKGADRTVTADSQGDFRFEKVDLTADFAAGARLREVPVTEFRDVQLGQEAREAKTTKLVVIATDQAGLRGAATQNIQIGTCWSGNQSWEITPSPQFQGPPFLSTERMREGTEAIRFLFKYSYIGRGTNAKILPNGISLSKACSLREQIDPRFNISCQIMPQGDAPLILNKPDNTASYSEMPLNRFAAMDEFLDKDWKSFFKALGFNREMTFPLKVRITYEHEVIDENGETKRVRETQTACEQVSYVADNTIIDPRKVLGNWVLYDFVGYLQDSIKTLSQVQKQIDKVVEYVAIGCLYSLGANTVFKIYRNWAEFADEKIFLLKEVLFKTGNSQYDQDCSAIADAIKKGHDISLKNLKLKYFSDADLKKCFPRSYAAWQIEAKTYQLQRWSCDRLFGHAAPSKWTEDEGNDELNRKITAPKGCEADGVERGQPIRARDCRSIEGKYREVGIFNFGNQPIGKKCFEVQSNPKDPSAYYVWTLSDSQDAGLISNKIYKLVPYENRPREEFIYVTKVTEDQYFTAQPKTCKEICGISAESTIDTASMDGEVYSVEKGELKERKTTTDVNAIKFSGCIPKNTCVQWYAKSIPDKEGNVKGIYLPKYGTYLKDYTAESRGYTSDCFYKDGLSPEVLSPTDANLRRVCCCVTGKTSKDKDLYYYEPNDIDDKLEAFLPRKQIVHESKSIPESPPQSREDDSEGYSDMKWSYRYSRIGYLNKKYNPNRYIEGRDLPACLGQDNLFYKIFGREEEVLSVNPFQQHTAALQCLYLTGVNQRLQLFQNIMASLSNCLIEVRQSGRADAGVCKELFTQHVCSTIWQAVRFFVDGCAADDQAVDSEDRENKAAENIRLGLKGIAKGISEAQQEISNEYQNIKLDNLIGIGEESVARKVCLGAFGYDWGINARNLIDAAYSAPFATLVQPFTKSREFLGANPLTLKPKYEYRASWLINPGCDFENYRVDLVCVTRKEMDKYPNQINCGAVGAPSIFYTGQAPLTGPSTAYSECDCLELNQEHGPTRTFFTGNRLKQNKLEEKDRHEVLEDVRRYDHLKFTLRTDRRILPNIKQNCFPTGYEDGVFYRPITQKGTKDIKDCTIDVLSGTFTCSAGEDFFSRKGTVQLLEVTINDINPEKYKDALQLTAGEPLSVGVRVTKTGQDKCLRVSVSPDLLEAYEGIVLNGTNDIPPITVINSLSVVKASGSISTDSRLSVRAIELGTLNPVTINVNFVSEDNAIFEFNDLDDKAMIEGRNNQLESVVGLLSDGKLIVSKDGVVIEILGVALNPPTVAGQPHSLSTTITVNPVQQVPTQAAQQKTVLLEFFNLKEDRNSYDGAPDNCELNDKVLERQYRVIVNQRALDKAELAPSISIPRVNPPQPRIGDEITISVQITHEAGIKKGGVSLLLNGPDYKDKKFEMEEKENNYFEYTLRDSTLKAGPYNGFIKAISKTDTTNNRPFPFTLRQKEELK